MESSVAIFGAITGMALPIITIPSTFIGSISLAILPEISNEKTTVPRFSAGYGDFSLEFQRNICDALDCQRKIGITLQESLIMLPTKSVTAIIGIKNRR